MIEKTLEKILEQLVVLNSKVAGAEVPAPTAEQPAPAPKETKKEKKEAAKDPEPTGAPQISRKELGEALVALAKVDMEKAKALLAQFKATKLDEVATSDYVALAAAIVASAPKAPAAVTAESLL